MSGLLNADYSVPSSGESSYMKFVKGENRFRILDTPVCLFGLVVKLRY